MTLCSVRARAAVDRRHASSNGVRLRALGAPVMRSKISRASCQTVRSPRGRTASVARRATRPKVRGKIADLARGGPAPPSDPRVPLTTRRAPNMPNAALQARRSFFQVQLGHTARPQSPRPRVDHAPAGVPTTSTRRSRPESSPARLQDGGSHLHPALSSRNAPRALLQQSYGVCSSTRPPKPLPRLGGDVAALPDPDREPTSRDASEPSPCKRSSATTACSARPARDRPTASWRQRAPRRAQPRQARRTPKRHLAHVLVLSWGRRDQHGNLRALRRCRPAKGRAGAHCGSGSPVSRRNKARSASSAPPRAWRFRSESAGERTSGAVVLGVAQCASRVPWQRREAETSPQPACAPCPGASTVQTLSHRSRDRGAPLTWGIFTTQPLSPRSWVDEDRSPGVS